VERLAAPRRRRPHSPAPRRHRRPWALTRPALLAGVLLAAALLSVESGFGEDGQGGRGQRERPSLAPPNDLQVAEASATSISLTWKASASERGVEGYRLYVNADEDDEPVAKTTEAAFTFSGLECGTAYTLTVEAYGPGGRRSEAIAIVASTAACPDREAPSTPGNLVQSESSEASVRVSWSASTDGVGVVGYGIYLGGLLVATTAELSYAFPGLDCGSSYTIGVAASDAAGNQSAQASLIIATKACSRRGAPSPPTNLRQTDQGETSVGLAWNGSNRAARYNVYRDGSRAGTTRETTYSVSGLACGSSYTVAVEAEDAAGERSDMATVLVTTSRCSQPPPAPGSDNEAPSAPTGIEVTAVTDTTASLAWTKSTDNVGVTGYALYADGVQVASVAGTAYTLSGLVCGTTYKIGVDAYDAAGHRSDQVSAVVTTAACRGADTGTPPPSDPGSGTQPPSDTGSESQTPSSADSQAPTAPRRVRLVAATSDSLSVRWPAATDNVGVEGYVLSLNGAEIGVTPRRRHTFTDLACETGYVVSVAAYDAAGNRSGARSASFATSSCGGPPPDTEPPTSPGDLVMTGATQTTVSISWGAASDNVGVAGYDVYFNGESAGTTDATSFTFTELACGTSYPVEVQSYDAAGNRSDSAAVVVSTEACADTEPPSTPTELNMASRTRTSITVQWTASTDDTGVVGYRLYRNGADAGTTTETNHIFSGLSCGASYTLGVRAYDAAGNDSGLATLLATTSTCSDTSAPTTPTGLRKTGATETTISLAWNASTDNVAVAGYGVYRAGSRVATPTSTAYTVSGLVCGTTYALGVDAYDAAGNRSGVAPLNAATSPCPSTGGALLVAPGGSDSNPCTPAAPCATFDRAYRAAQPGQAVDVAGGTYPAQLIRLDPAKTSAENVTFQPASGANVFVAGRISLGDFGVPGPSHITLQGLRADEIRALNNITDLTLENIDARNFYLNGVQNALIKGGDWGPCTAGVDPCSNSKIDLSDAAFQLNENITIDGAVFHDYRVSDPSQHFECLIIFSGSNITIRNSRFYGCAYYDIFLQHIADRRLGDLIIENNWFDDTYNGYNQLGQRDTAVEFSRRGRTISNVLVRYNSFQTDTGISWVADGGSYSNVRAVGNVIGVRGACPGDVTFAYNIFLSGGTCAATDRQSAPAYVNGGNGPGWDLHLISGASAVNLVPGSGADSQVVNDIDGQSRPIAALYDAGSDEAG
jgi:chitodextrinase